MTWRSKILSSVWFIAMTTSGCHMESPQQDRPSGTKITEPAELWSVRIDGTCGDSGVIAGEFVVLSISDERRQSTHIEARRLSNGALGWTNPTGGIVGPVYGGKVVVSARESIVAIDVATGKERWRFASISQGRFSAPSVRDGKHLYVADFRSPPGRIRSVGPSTFYCLNADTGKEMWHMTIPTGVMASPVSFDEDNIYVVREGGLSCISKRTRHVVWSKDTHTVRAPAVCSKGSVVVPTHGLECFSAEDGSLRWRMGGKPNPYHSRAVDGVVYTALSLRGDDSLRSEAYDSCAAAIHAHSGKTVWKRKFSAPVRGGAALEGGRVYFTCWDDSLYCLDAQDGRILWRYAIPLKQWAPIPLVTDGGIVLCFRDTVVHVGEKNGELTHE